MVVVIPEHRTRIKLWTNQVWLSNQNFCSYNSLLGYVQVSISIVHHYLYSSKFSFNIPGSQVCLWLLYLPLAYLKNYIYITHILQIVFIISMMIYRNIYIYKLIPASFKYCSTPFSFLSWNMLPSVFLYKCGIFSSHISKDVLFIDFEQFTYLFPFICLGLIVIAFN